MPKPSGEDPAASQHGPDPQRQLGSSRETLLDRQIREAVEDGRFVCERSGFQASNVLSGLAGAGGLALLPDGDGVAAGAEVEVLLFGA